MAIIVSKEDLAPGVFELVIDAPRIARRRKPGQFVIVRASDVGERIPLTIADADREAGTINLVIQAVGLSTKLMSTLKPGDELLDVAGPRGAQRRSRRWVQLWESAADLGSHRSTP